MRGSFEDRKLEGDALRFGSWERRTEDWAEGEFEHKAHSTNPQLSMRSSGAGMDLLSCPELREEGLRIFMSLFTSPWV